MSAPRDALALATLIGAMAVPGVASAGEVAIAPPPTIAQDKSDPVCKTSLVHCDQTDFKDNPQDIVDQTRAVAPTALRRATEGELPLHVVFDTNQHQSSSTGGAGPGGPPSA